MNPDQIAIAFICTLFVGYNAYAEFELCRRIGCRADKSVIAALFAYSALCGLAMWRLA